MIHRSTARERALELFVRCVWMTLWVTRGGEKLSQRAVCVCVRARTRVHGCVYVYMDVCVCVYIGVCVLGKWSKGG